MLNNSRLYVFTGKGGVGKTTLSLSFCLYLNSIGKDVTYVTLEKIPNSHLLDKLKINYEELLLEDCLENYISKKLKSKIMAQWIMKTPFFKALVQMVPGFNYLIYLGYILDEKLKKNPNKIIILDSPSTGHAITMFESCYNFKEIFQIGLLVDDINKMLNYVYEEGILKTHVISLPLPLAIHEGIELKEHLHSLKFENVSLDINNCLSVIENLDEESKNDPFWNKKINNEKLVINNYQDKINTVMPHLIADNYEELLTKLYPKMETFL